MDSRRRTVELDQDVADALEKRAAERGVSLEAHVVDLASLEIVQLDPEDLAELDARSAEWDRDHLGYEADKVFDWLRDRIEGKDTPRLQLKRFRELRSRMPPVAT